MKRAIDGFIYMAAMTVITSYFPRAFWFLGTTLIIEKNVVISFHSIALRTSFCPSNIIVRNAKGFLNSINFPKMARDFPVKLQVKLNP